MSAVRRIAAQVAPWALEMDHPEPLLAAIHFSVQTQAELERDDRDAVVERVLTEEPELLDPESPYFPSPDFPAEFEAFKHLPVK